MFASMIFRFSDFFSEGGGGGGGGDDNSSDGGESGKGFFINFLLTPKFVLEGGGEDILRFPSSFAPFLGGEDFEGGVLGLDNFLCRRPALV